MIAPMTDAFQPRDFTVVRKATVRASAAPSSREVGQLQVGKVVRVMTEEHVRDDSGVHIRSCIGDGMWVARRTGKGSVLLVEYSPSYRLYTAVNKMTVRKALSTDSAEVRSVAPGHTLVVMEVAAYSGHHRGRIGDGEWVSLRTAKSKVLACPQGPVEAPIQAQDVSSLPAMATVASAQPTSAQPTIPVATANPMPVAMANPAVATANPMPVATANMVAAQVPMGAAPPAGVVYRVVSLATVRQGVSPSTAAIGELPVGSMVHAIQETECEGHLRVAFMTPGVAVPVWSSIRTAKGSTLMERCQSAVAAVAIPQETAGGGGMATAVVTEPLQDQFVVLVDATIRSGISPSKDKIVGKLPRGLSVTILEQQHCEGHLRGRIAPSLTFRQLDNSSHVTPNWVSLRTSTGFSPRLYTIDSSFPSPQHVLQLYHLYRLCCWVSFYLGTGQLPAIIISSQIRDDSSFVLRAITLQWLWAMHCRKLLWLLRWLLLPKQVCLTLSQRPGLARHLRGMARCQ